MTGARWIVVAVWMLLAGQGLADVRVPDVFSNNMVLQRDAEVTVWGWADPEEDVTVRFGDQEVSARADVDGTWRVALAPMPARTGPAAMTIRAANELTITNVLVGEVWICSGQSNMAWPLRRSTGAKDAAADVPLIRHVRVPQVTAPAPQDDVSATWVVATEETSLQFTAVGYHFALNLVKELGVPVGLINNSWGGSRIEPYISLEGARQHHEVAAAVSNEISDLETVLGDRKAMDREFVAAIRDWLPMAERAVGAGDALPALPSHPAPTLSAQKLAMKFNAMVHPLIPYAIRGALWYQGESNMGDAHYAAKMQAMITDWRSRWDCGPFPFYYVQLAPFGRYSGEKLGRFWEQQQNVLSMVANTGMAVTSDIGTLRNIHPPNKKDVGHRLARLALHHDYGRDDLAYTGPVYTGMSTASNKVVLTFDHAEGLTGRDAELKWFEIAGADRVFHPVAAVIVDGKVEVSSDKTPEPVAVRMGWLKDAEPALYNSAGLPASPFRTDDW